jgi:hypothetical protein
MPEFPAIEIVIAIAGALTTIIGGATSSDFFVRLAVKLLKTRLGDRLLLLSPEDRAVSPPFSIELVDTPGVAPRAQHENVDKAMRHLLNRLKQANTLRKRNLIQAEVYSWSARLLTFSQYIVGGVLTLSFVKQTFSPGITGTFGVIVFVASGLNQRFNPAANAEISSQKSEQLEFLIRESEDKIVALETTTDFSDDDPKHILDLDKKVSAEITKIISITKGRKRAGHS